MQVLKRGSENDVLGVAGDGAFVLSPEEGPVVEVLEVVWLTEQQAWCHVSWDKREVGTVVTIEHLLRTGCAYNSYKRVAVL